MRQVFRIEREVTRRRRDGTQSEHHEVVYGVTSLSAEQASPSRIGELARGHWRIENGLHWVRDVTFDEDRCQIRTGTGARAFACLRNLAISVLRLARCSNIASGLRHLARGWRRAFRLLGL